MNRSILSSSLRKPHYSLFLKLLRLTCKIFLGVFLFCLRIRTVHHKENLLMTETSNSRIQRYLGNTEDAIERPNQTTLQLFFYNQCNMRFYIIAMKNNASSVRKFWPFFYYGDFQFIKLIAIFSKIDGFLEKGAHSRLYLSNPTKWIKKFSSGKIQALQQLKIYCP